MKKSFNRRKFIKRNDFTSVFGGFGRRRTLLHFAGKKRFTMETFYRWQRHRLGYLMDGDEPVTGRWNYDEDNRHALPKGGVDFPEPIKDQLDDLDREVIENLPDSVVGATPAGWWPTSRSGALARLTTSSRRSCLSLDLMKMP